jgi:hypothetical protein
MCPSFTAHHIHRLPVVHALYFVESFALAFLPTHVCIDAQRFGSKSCLLCLSGLSMFGLDDVDERVASNVKYFKGQNFLRPSKKSFSAGVKPCPLR